MKKFKYIALLVELVVCSEHITHGQVNSFDNLDCIEKKSNYRLTLALSLLAITGYCNHQKVLSFYKTYPFSSLALSYLTGTILIDTYTQYKIINKNLSLLKVIDQVYRYLKSALFIEPDKEKCFKLIEQHSLFSIEEIEKITQIITFNSLKRLNCSANSQISYECPNIHQLACHEKDFFDKNSIDFIELKNDPEIYKELMSFKKNKSIDKDKIFAKIGKKINQKVTFLIKNKNFK